jgi:hypothetical protein
MGYGQQFDHALAGETRNALLHCEQSSGRFQMMPATKQAPVREIPARALVTMAT